MPAAAYRHYLEYNRLDARIDDALAVLDTHDVRSLAVRGAKSRQWIMRGEIPEDLASEIRTSYKALSAEYGPSPDVAVRSSATAEDLPGASFAGQQETCLNIRGTDNLLATCKRVFASLFTDRAISYRVDKGFDHRGISLSVGVQKMVRADLGAAGVMFTLDTETGFRDVMFINTAYGVGENVVQGAVNPDEFYVFKPPLAQGHRPILKRQLGGKERERFALSDDEVLRLARHAVAIERHYSQLAGRDLPMGIRGRAAVSPANGRSLRAAASRHAHPAQCRQSRERVRRAPIAARRRRSRATRVHHQQRHPHPPARTPRLR